MAGSTLSENTECRLWNKAKNSNGYDVIKYKWPPDGSWHVINVHRLSYIVNKQILPDEIANLDISHLCHNKLCVSITHLNAELHGINKERETCANRNACQLHGNLPPCLLQFKQ